MSGTNSGLWYVRSHGKVRGPFSVDMLRTERDRGRLDPNCELSADRRRWFPAGSFAELCPLTPAPADPSKEQWYFMRVGRRHGPMPLATLQQAVAAGQCSEHDLVWQKVLP